MLDPNLIRKNPEEVKKKIATKKTDPKVVDRWLRVDETRRQLIVEIQKWREKRNRLEKGDVETGRQIKSMLRKLEPDLQAVEEQYKILLLQIPNLPADDVPVGKDESENKVLRSWGEPPKLSFKPKDHLELGEALGLVDVQTASKVAGSRFGYLMREAVLMEFGLVQLVFGLLTDEKELAPLANKAGVSPRPFLPVVPPVFIKPGVYRQMCRLSDADKEPLQKAIEKTRELAKGQDSAAIKSAVSDLEQAAHAFSKTLYERGQASGGGGAAHGSPEGGGPTSSGHADDDAIDAEFEVKDS